MSENRKLYLRNSSFAFIVAQMVRQIMGVKRSLEACLRSKDPGSGTFYKYIIETVDEIAKVSQEKQ